MEKEVKLSAGTCTVREASASEMNERRILMALISEDVERRFGRSQEPKAKAQMMKAKAQALNAAYYEFLAGRIVKHDFPLQTGVELADYVGGLSPDDAAKVENAVDELSSLSQEVKQDLPRQSQAGGRQRRRRTESSS